MSVSDWHYFIAGIMGAIIGAQLREGGLELPSLVSIKNGTGKRLCLGSLVGLLAGGLAGMYADNSIWNAAVWGFGGIVFVEQAFNKVLKVFQGQGEEK